MSECLCLKCKWQEVPSIEECKDCEDHKAGVCMMAEAYQQGRSDALSELYDYLFGLMYTNNLLDNQTMYKIKEYIELQEQKNE